jgi:hypothetical protein
MREDDELQPDPQTAEAHLRRVRAQRPEVDALVDSLVRERRLNNFTANVVVTFQGGRR